MADGLRGFAEVIDLWYRGGDWANQWLSMRHVLGIFADLGAHRAAAVLHGALVAAGAAAALPFEPGDAEQLAAEANRARDVLGAAEFASRRAPRRSDERRRHRRLRAGRDRPLARGSVIRLVGGLLLEIDDGARGTPNLTDSYRGTHVVSDTTRRNAVARPPSSVAHQLNVGRGARSA